MKAGVYLLGLFIETSEETRNDGTRSNYVTITTGGRKGAISVKFAPEKQFFEYFADCELGSEVMLKVRPSGYKDAVYYTLEDVISIAAVASEVA